MKSKKHEIISSFENLDADSLDNLLDETRVYQDVPKSIFVQKLRDFFQDLIEQDFLVYDFKAYPGTCNQCSKGAKGYSFVNSENYCYAHIIFEENDDEFTDIYSCNNFCSSHSDIKETFYGIYFDDDQEVGFMLNFDELVEKEFCLRAIEEIKQELTDKQVLSIDFMSTWRKKYSKDNDKIDIFNNISYTFRREIKGYLGSIRNALSFIELSRKAKFYLDLYQDEIFIDIEAKMMWLFACLDDIPDIKLFLHAKINVDANYITFHKINIDLALMKDYLELQKVFIDLQDLIPYTIINHLPWEWVDPTKLNEADGETNWADEEDLPF